MSRTAEAPYEHDYEDVNKSKLVGHHTLGLHPYQASAGNHTHRKDDISSVPLFEGITIDLTGLSTEQQIRTLLEVLAEYGLKSSI